MAKAKSGYDWKVGFQKTMQNVAVQWVAPAILLLVSNYTDWVPQEYAIKLAPVMAAIGYGIKNYLKNK